MTNINLRRFCRWAFPLVLVPVACAYDYIRNSGGFPVTWDPGTVVLQIQLGTGPILSDGSNYNSSVLSALDTWNTLTKNVQLEGQPAAAAAPINFNGANEIGFDDTIYGTAFDPNVLAVTISYYLVATRPDGTSKTSETDIIFNKAYSWDSYRGPLGVAQDIQRVALHELGHVLGLAHPDEANPPQNVVALMNSHVSDLDQLTSDDIAGAQSLYGVPSPSPIPPAITSANSATMGVGNLFVYAITATHNPTSFAASGLPTGLTFDATTGVISGRPTATGTYTIGLSATNFAGTGTGTLTLTVADAPPVVLSETSGLQILSPGDTATISVSGFSANGAISYQWVHDGRPIAAATANSLVIGNATLSSSGAYWVVVTNSIGSTRGPPIFVRVIPSVTQVRGWGWGNDNQIAIPNGLTDAIQIATGTANSLALRRDGTVVCWGTASSNISVIPANVTSVVGLDAGYQHAVGLKSDGIVVAWGFNSYGQTNVPVGVSQPGALMGVVAIASGDNHSLALKNDGSLVAWGYDGFGQTNVPRGLTGVVAIAAGGNHSLALKSDGTVVAWGDNSSGQISLPAGLTGVIAIAAGGAHSLALKSDGTVVGWGNNNSGQINVPAGLSGVLAISAGAAHSLALMEDGSVVGWGFNGNGETSPPTDLNSVWAISAGQAFSLALRDATGDAIPVIASQPTSQTLVEAQTAMLSVSATGAGPITYQWRKGGTDIAGATDSMLTLSNLGSSDAGDYDVIVTNHIGSVISATAVISVNPLPVMTSLSPTRQVRVPGESLNLGVTATGTGTLAYQWVHNGRVIANATGPNFSVPSVALSDSGWYVSLVTDDIGVRRSAPIFVSVAPAMTEIRAWGSNGYGELAIPNGLTDVIAISAGDVTALALKRDGTVVAWGTSQSGSTIVPAGLKDVVAIAAGPFQSLALKSDGTVVSWGWYNSGLNPPPVGLDNVVAIAANELHSMALKSDGTVVVWGGNPVAAPPPGVTNVVGIAAPSHGSSLALKSDGTLYLWNTDLGNQYPVPSGLNGVSAISAKQNVSLALKTDGTVVAWGSTFNSTTVSGDVIAVAAGDHHALALNKDGTVTAWGLNDAGQTDVPGDLTRVVAISAGTWFSLALREASNPIGATITGALGADFNGDGRTDILWTNSETGDRAMWQMNGTAIGTNAFLGTVPPAWVVSGTGDFNGDGKAGIFWTNTLTGDRAMWLMDGSTITTGGYLGRIAAEWVVSGTGDFNGDGKTDVLWTNTLTGERAIWLMNGTVAIGGASLGVVPLAWVVAGVDDFDGDGKADVLWRNTMSGDRAMWLMNGISISTNAFLGTVPTAWVISGTGDFDGDGKADILWTNTATGDRAMWLMNGGTMRAGGYLGAVSVAWVVSGTGDFNGDGKVDVLWTNTVTGERAIWLMDGTVASGGASLGVVPIVWSVGR